ncbi:hypothetical protein D3C78_1020640 [compost metagenome]
MLPLTEQRRHIKLFDGLAIRSRQRREQRGHFLKKFQPLIQRDHARHWPRFRQCRNQFGVAGQETKAFLAGAEGGGRPGGRQLLVQFAMLLH